MTSDDVNLYVGKPWTADGMGPDAFSCWGLVRHIYEKYKGVKLNNYLNACGLVARERAEVIEKEAGDSWTLIQNPEHLCVVVLAKNKLVHHVGIYLQLGAGVVLHSHRGCGAITQTLAQLRLSGWTNIKFYAHNR